MKAWQLLDSREKWCTGVYSRNSDGEPTMSDIDDAVSWNMIAAIWKCYGDPMYWPPMKKLMARVDQSNMTLMEYNDTHTYEEVHALLKELDI